MVHENLLPRSLRGERHFRWRGGEVSRVEGLSDAVFALSGLVFFLMGPVQGISGYRTGKAVEDAAAQQLRPQPAEDPGGE